MREAVERAPAKLNLYLHILGRRDDGYHALESLVVFSDLTDTLRVLDHKELTLTLNGEFADAAGAGDDNLVLKAARLLQAETGTDKGAAITLTKNIPVGAGLGGGSADAAATLRVLNRFWELGLSDAQLHPLATKLGADVAMCLASTPAIARGIGEQLAPLAHPLPVLHAVLVHPRTPLLTADVFRRLDVASGGITRDFSVPQKGETPEFLSFLAHETRNDLQRPAISILPEVGEVLLALETMLPRAGLVRMSGSGACCFALYGNAEDAAKAAAALRTHHAHWWVSTAQIT